MNELYLLQFAFHSSKRWIYRYTPRSHNSEFFVSCDQVAKQPFVRRSSAQLQCLSEVLESLQMKRGFLRMVPVLDGVMNTGWTAGEWGCASEALSAPANARVDHVTLLVFLFWALLDRRLWTLTCWLKSHLVCWFLYLTFQNSTQRSISVQSGHGMVVV